jgi:serine phosphatase RsbU (regulator of sigma subunit)
MIDLSELDPLLARQLKRLGITDLSQPPDRDTWEKALGRISDHYKHVADDRTLLTRSLELSTGEMSELHRRLTSEHARLRGLVTAIGDALTVFHDVATSRPGVDTSRGSDTTGSINVAKRRFSARLEEIFPVAATDDEPDDVVNEIRTNFLYLADQLVHLLHETAEKASLKKQLEVARAVQQMLVPLDDVIDRPFVRLCGHFQPAAECGGDWWTVHDLPGGKVLTVIGDVTGHGISSAIITGAAKAACDLARNFTGGKLTSASLLEMMNCSIFEAGRQKLMMTCAASIFDPETSTLSLANAGHHFPFLARHNAVRPLVSHGSPLGAAEGTEYQAITVEVVPGDAVLWFTDGVTECENAAREQFSEKRLRAVFQAAAAGGPVAARDAIVRAVAAFRGDQALADDVTLVVAGVK